MMNTLFQVIWGAPHHIVWFLLYGVLLGILAYRFIKQRKTVQLLASKMPSLMNSSRVKNISKVICMSIGLLFLFIALLRPQWSKVEESVMQEGRDLYIALDISRSMLATDVVPNRLAWAKEKIKHLVKQLLCDRVGLILFSGSAFVQCPLTTDYSAFYMYLDAVDAEMISLGTTALGTAIMQAVTSFMMTPERKNKLLVIFTDGEDFSHDLADTQKSARDEGLSIFTVGVGTTEGAPVPTFDQYGNSSGHQKDTKGAVVISRLNESILKTVSHEVGGKYVKGSQNDDDIKVLINVISSFEKEQLGEKKFSRAQDQYHYFLFVSFICFLFEWLL